MTEPQEEVRRHKFMSNALYDWLKWVAQIVLPAMGALYFGIAMIWHLPYAQEVVGTIVTVDAFLGAILGISTAQYNASAYSADGIMTIDRDDPGKDKYLLELFSPIEKLEEKDRITFKVQ